MAQIIKHRRGSIDAVKGSTARKGELIMATGSVDTTLQGPFLFIGSDDGTGLYSPASKLYAGSSAPNIAAATYGSSLDGTPFYATSEKSLYILQNSNVGNSKIDLTGNLEGNTISGITINSLSGSRATFDTYVSASALNVTGNTQMIGTLDVNGSTTVNNNLTVTGTTSVSGTTNLGSALNVTGATTLYSATTINAGLTVTGTTSVSGTTNLGSDLNVTGATTLYSATTINAGLTVTGNTSVSGTTNLGSDLNVTGATTLYSSTTINDNLTVTGTTSVSGTTYLGGDLNVNGNSHFTGSVNVTGNTSLTGSLVVSDGSATFNQGLVAQNSNLLLTSGSNIVIENGGNLQVAGDASVSGALYVSGNIYQTGSFYTQGSIVLSGSINIGDFTGDTINFAGEVNSNILPTTTATYNLGSSGQTWNDIWAENAHFTNLDLGSITLNSLSLPGNLEVSGLTTLYSSTTINSDLTVTGTTSVSGTTNLGSDLNVTGNTTFNGDVTITGLTDNRVVIVGTSGLLEDDANFTFDGTTLSLGTGNLEIDQATGNLRTSGSVLIDNNLTVTGTTSVSGTTNLGSDLNVTGATTLYSATTINAGLTVTGNTSVSGTTYLGGNLNVTGVTTLYSATTINDNLTVTGTTSISGNTTINGTTTINNDLTVTGSTSISGTTTINGYTTIDSGLTVTDVLNVSGSTTIDGSTTINDDLTVTGTTSISGVTTLGNDLNVSGTTLMGDDVSLVSGNTLYVNHIADYNNSSLDITTDNNLLLESTNTRNITLRTDNAESGINYLHVNNDGVDFSTYDFTSGLTHKVLLDNTGSLKLENVKLALTGSLGLSGSLDVSNNTTIHGDLYVSGNVQFLGTGSYINISASQVDLGTNIINLNTYAPFERFAGINVYDSGSNAGVTGSLLWDSTNNVWIYANPSGSNYASARFISGPQNTGSLGQETGLTNGHFTIAVGDDHIADSLLTYIGTELALNTNKFTVDSGTGDTLIAGNFTIQGTGTTDNGNYSSYIVFRNDDDVLGFVSTTDTENVTDRLLGYNATTGVLEFSSLIDGGTY